MPAPADARQNRIVSITVNPTQTEGGRGFAIIGSDVTERQMLEMQLHQAQKLESVGTLAAGIAHEINTPMQFVSDNLRFVSQSVTPLTSVLQLIPELVDCSRNGVVPADLAARLELATHGVDVAFLADELPAALGEMQEGVNRVTTIVRAMKDFSHPGNQGRQSADLNKAIATTVSVARNEYKYHADVELDFGDIPLADCYVADLNQVFLNLLVNAAHAIKDVIGDGGGRGTIRISTRLDGDMIEIRVADSGAGIPEHVLEDLRPVLHDQGRGQGHRARPRHRPRGRDRQAQGLDPLRVGDGQGHDLHRAYPGLGAARRPRGRAARHAARCPARGRSRRRTVRPLHPVGPPALGRARDAARDGRHDPRPRSNVHVKRILFVDDEQRVLSGLRRQLHARRAIWEMQFVDGGLPALAELARAQAAGTPYDVVVSDMRMPGMDGAQLLARVSEDFSHVGRLVPRATPIRIACSSRAVARTATCRSRARRRRSRPRCSRRSTCARRWIAWAGTPRARCGARRPSASNIAPASLPRWASEADTDAVVAGLLDSFTHDTAFWARLGLVLGAAFPTQVRPGAGVAATIAAMGTRNILSLVMALRFADAFGGPPDAVRQAADLAVARQIAAIGACENSGLEAVAQVVMASMLKLPPPGLPGAAAGPGTSPPATRAAGATPTSAAAPAVNAPAVHATVANAPAVNATADRSTVLSWLLPTWGFKDAVVAAAACREAPALCPPPSSGPLVLLAGADLLLAWSDPSVAPDAAFVEARMSWLSQRGWTEPRTRWAAAVTSGAGKAPSETPAPERGPGADTRRCACSARLREPVVRRVPQELQRWITQSSSSMTSPRSSRRCGARCTASRTSCSLPRAARPRSSCSPSARST